jgi:hypothetical protein
VEGARRAEGNRGLDISACACHCTSTVAHASNHLDCFCAGQSGDRSGPLVSALPNMQQLDRWRESVGRRRATDDVERCKASLTGQVGAQMK